MPNDISFSEIEALHEIKLSYEWKFYINILQKHSIWLGVQMELYLKGHDYQRAGEFRAMKENTQKIVSILSERINSLKVTKED